jgi:hypothetical protein
VADAPEVRPVADRAEVNRITHGITPAPHQHERRDAALHHALRAWEFSAEPEAPTPPPDESCYREQLKLAAEVLAQAIAAERQAEEAHQRALQHQRACRERVTTYANLDEQIASAMTAALRADDDVAQAQAAFASKLAERAAVQAEVTAADTATARLGAEHAEAGRAVEKATAATDKLAAHILAFPARSLADECRGLKAQFEARRRCLLGYDRVAASCGIGLPVSVQVVLGEIDSRTALGADPQPWKEAAAALKADPGMVVEIALPEPVLTPLPVPRIFSPVVERAIPLARVEPVAPELDDGSGLAAPDDGDPCFIPPEPA